MSRPERNHERLVDPYGLVHMVSRWYAPGYCHLRADLRLFRLDRVRGVDVLDVSFERRWTSTR